MNVRFQMGSFVAIVFVSLSLVNLSAEEQSMSFRIARVEKSLGRVRAQKTIAKRSVDANSTKVLAEVERHLEATLASLNGKPTASTFAVANKPVLKPKKNNKQTVKKAKAIEPDAAKALRMFESILKEEAAKEARAKLSAKKAQAKKLLARKGRAAEKKIAKLRQENKRLQEAIKKSERLRKAAEVKLRQMQKHAKDLRKRIERILKD